MGRCGTVVHSLCKKGYRLILQPATGDNPCLLALLLGSSLVVNGVDMALLWGDHLSVHRFWFTLMELNNCTIWSDDGVEAETDRGAIRTPVTYQVRQNLRMGAQGYGKVVSFATP